MLLASTWSYSCVWSIRRSFHTVWGLVCFVAHFMTETKIVLTPYRSDRTYAVRTSKFGGFRRTDGIKLTILAFSNWNMIRTKADRSEVSRKNSSQDNYWECLMFGFCVWGSKTAVRARNRTILALINPILPIFQNAFGLCCRYRISQECFCAQHIFLALCESV